MSEAVVEDEVPSEPKKGRLWLWITILLVVLGAGGAAGWYFFMGQADGTEGADAQEEAPKGPALYVALDPPFVVNFQTQQLVRFLQVSIQVMTRDLLTQDLLKSSDPLIRNNLLMLLGNQEYAVISTREGKDQLRQQALEIIRAAVQAEGGKPELVEAVYFTSFVMQ